MSADFGGAAGAVGRPALVVVDLSLGFTDPASPLGAELDAVVLAARRLIDAARAGGAPVIFTTVAYDTAGERAAAVFLAKVPALRVLAAGSRWVELDPRLGRRDDEPLIVKPWASAFFATPLASLLAGSGCDAVVVCGASTSGCVRATAVDAMQHGYVPVVPREAVGDRWPDAHAATLFDLEQKYAEVVGLEEAEVTLRVRKLEGPPRAGAGDSVEHPQRNREEPYAVG